MEAGLRGGPKNAFERARASALTINTSWWNIAIKVLRSAQKEVYVSRRAQVVLADLRPTVGSVEFDRRTIRYRPKGKRNPRTFVVSRPTDFRLSSLPLAAVKGLANEMASEAEREWRRIAIEQLVREARSQTGDDLLELARDLLGPGASDSEIKVFSEQMRFPLELIEGGEAAEKFFDENVSMVSIEETEDGEEKVSPQAPPPPGLEPFGDSEWDYYTAEELSDRGGPESDRAYAFRVSTLCRVLEEQPGRAQALSIQLGAVIREWEIWREFGEFIQAGMEKFARQYKLAKSKPERPWMIRVRKDWADGKIGIPVAAYARGLKRDRTLGAPSLERIRNFISELRRSSAP
jgi:hypothetical protein